MSDGLPRYESVEHLGDDSPTVGQRLGEAARTHRGITAAAIVLAVALSAGVALAWWRTRPAELAVSPVSPLVAVGSTGQGGVVLERAGEGDSRSATVAIEVTVSLKDQRSAGKVSGIGGPGITASSAGRIPPIAPGETSVGVVTTTVQCASLAPASTYRLVVEYRPTRAGSLPSTLQGALGAVEPEWGALLIRACTG